ncbi:thermonuclease family protein [Afipia sp. P52-10]|uniref:thermonuclease family protein n=1 Tax=Afipia sp. P52-10 TaxID=1429916 RepID=UPI0009DF046E|nr:thermonuclease family protein [Afipia sp. P52-10]
MPASRRRPIAHHIVPYLFIAAVILLCIAGFAFHNWLNPTPPATIAGKAWVIDGDTVSITNTHIRLEGIDAPESDQTCLDAAGKNWPCGQNATRALRRLIAGRELSCAERSKDRYGRLLAVCRLPDGVEINAWMVREGWALASGFVKLYEAEETEATAAKRGIWAGTFTKPWHWRDQHPRQWGGKKTDD